MKLFLLFVFSLFVSVNLFSQNVGIGIATPAQKLHVGGSTNTIRVEGLATGGSHVSATTAATDQLVYTNASGDLKAMPNGGIGAIMTIDAFGIPKWTTPAAAPVTNWTILGNTGTSAAVNFIGTTDAIDWVIKTNNTEWARVTAGGLVGIGTAAPQANYKLTVSNSIGGSGIYVFNSGGGAYGIYATAANAATNNILGINSGNSAGSAYYAVGGQLTGGAPVLANGYIGYHSGAAGGNYYAGYFNGKTVVTSDNGPTSVADFEVQNTTAGVTPVTLSIRPTTQVTVANTDLAQINFGSSYSTSPQAQIKAIRELTSSNSADIPTAITFSTIPDGSSAMAERMRIMNSGNVGIGVVAPLQKLHIGGLTNTVRIDGLATGGSFIAAAAATTDKVIYANATGDLKAIPNGSPGQILALSAATIPTWTSANALAWTLVGNSGTVAGTNFIGTTDAVDWVVKTSNVERMRVAAGGNVGIGAVPTANDKTYIYSSSKGANLSNLYVYNDANVNGTSWSYTGIAALIKGYSYWGNTYSAGVAGYSYHDYANSAGVIGANQSGTYMGALGYYDGTNSWGVWSNYNHAAGNGSVGAPSYSFANDANTGIYRYASNQIGFATAGVLRMWMSGLGEVFVGAAAPVLAGDMFIATNSGAVAFPWPVNGYTYLNGGGIYGRIMVGNTTQYAAVQGEADGTLAVATQRGVYGIALNDNWDNGVEGWKPAGGLGWAGVFYNDLGFTGFFGVASDKRLKSNIKSVSSVLDDLTKLNVYTYQFDPVKYPNLGGDYTHYGFMADEVESIFPDVVKSKLIDVKGNASRESTEPVISENIKMVNYLEIVPILTQAIKEQQEEIELLKKKIEVLEQK